MPIFLSIALERELAFALKRDIVLEFVLDRGLALEFALDRALTLARVLSPAVGLDYGLYYAWIYTALFAKDGWPRADKVVGEVMPEYPNMLIGIGELAQQAGAVGLAATLVELPVLPVTASTTAWQQQADQLLELLRQRDLVHEWQFDQAQINKLDAYLTANELLVECLKVALVSDRQGVLAGVLAVPKPA